MSTIGITTNLISQIASVPSAANEFVTDLNRLAQHLKSGDLAAAQQDLAEFSEDVLKGAAFSTASTSTGGITTPPESGSVSSTEASTSSTAVIQQPQSPDISDSSSSTLALNLRA